MKPVATAITWLGDEDHMRKTLSEILDIRFDLDDDGASDSDKNNQPQP